MSSQEQWSGPGKWVPRQVAPRPGPVARSLGAARDRLVARPGFQAWVAREFHRQYYDARDMTWLNTRWRGVPVAKIPFDLWTYQELLHELRPDLLIETGTFNGGSALFYADIMDIIGNGAVISIDLDSDTTYPEHSRISYITGSSVSEEVLARVRERVAAPGVSTVMVVLDSDHSERHVAAELAAYAGFVTPGSYLVVEDTNINGNPVAPEFGPGAHEATEAFLAATDEFEVDLSREKFFVTFNPGGWLRRR